MAKRSEGRAPRGADRGARRREDTDLPPWRRWWNGATKTIVGAGALASAVAAVVSLWPGPDPVNAASFSAVRIAPEVPFSEYRQRQVTAHASGEDTVGWGGLRLAAATPSADEPEPEPEPEPSDTGPPESPTPETSPTPDPVSPPTDSTPPGAAAPEAAAVRIEPAVDRVDPPDFCDRMGEFAQACRDNAGWAGLVEKSQPRSAAPPPSGPSAAPSPGEPDGTNAAGLLGILRQARKAPVDETEPLGAVVTVDVELTGMRGRPALLSWSMWQQGGARRLHGEWLNTNLAYRLVATSDHDTASLDFWIPLPPEHGDYFIRSVLTVDGATVASADSETFR